MPGSVEPPDPAAARERSDQEVVNSLRRKVNTVPGVRARVRARSGLFIFRRLGFTDNDNLDVQFPRHSSVEVVSPHTARSESYQFVTADMVNLETPWQHGPEKLAEELMNLYWSVRSKTGAE